MSHLERYTPEICSQLRQIAESRQWHPWNLTAPPSAELNEDLLLTYHLHLAAEAAGVRAGLPPMPRFPIRCSFAEHAPDPAEFILLCLRRNPPAPWNRMDSSARVHAVCA